MFNEKIKKEWIKVYLEQYYMNKYLIDSIFNASEKLEQLVNKDICNFTKSEIEDFYKSLGAKSKERLEVTNSILKNYKNWCLNRNDGFCTDNISYFDFFTIEDFKGYISKNILENKYIGEEVLNSYLREINNPCDQLLLVLLYNGIKGKQMFDIINLNVNQIEGNVLHLASGTDVEVNKKIIDLIRTTNDIYEYYSYEANPKVWQLSGDNVLKDKRNARTNSMASIYHRHCMKIITFQKMFDNPELTINRIWKSGMLNALIKATKKNDIILEEFIYTEEAKLIFERYDFNQHPSKIIKLFSEYLQYIN